MKKIIIATLTLIVMIFVSCGKGGLTAPKATYPFQFKTVAILGNSITYSPQDLFEGWNGNWGMAASAANFDYVHVLTAKMKDANPDCQFVVRNIMQFEENWSDYDLSHNLDSIKNLHPDLVILRIGEDVPTPFDKEGFSRAYQSLVDYFGPEAVILGVGSFWPRDYTGNNTDEVMAHYANFVSLAPLGRDLSNRATNQWPNNPGIGQHPNDKGMQEIANLIWQTVQHYKPVN